MKKHLYGIIVSALFLVGLCVFLYPAVSSYVNEKHASRMIATYHQALTEYTEEDFAEIFAKADAYNKALAETPSAFYDPELITGYQEILDIAGNGIMGYLSIDKINVEIPVYHGVSDLVLQIGAGHLEGTSLPVGGKSTHCVLSGHRGLPSAKLFTDLDKMQIGDRFEITVLDRVLTYEVDQIKIVRPTDTADLQIRTGMDECTLLTCTPYGINTHRMLVRGVRVQGDEKPEKTGGDVFVPNEAFRIHTLIVAAVAAIPMLAFVLILLSVQDRRARRLARQNEKDAEEKKTDT